MNSNFDKSLRKWLSKCGRDEAMIRLIRGGLSSSTAEKICYDRYPGTMRNKVARILIEIMAKDGFILVDEKAS